MATSFWLTSQTATGAPAVTGYNLQRLLDTVVQSGSGRLMQGATSVGLNHIEMLDLNSAIYMRRIAAVTISGSITFAVCGSESAMTTNICMAVRVVRIDNSGTIVSEVVANGNANHASGVECGTSLARQTWSATPTSTTFADGDWIGVIPHGDAVGTMGTGFAKCQYDGDAASTADTNLTFTETITEYVASGSLLVPNSRRVMNSLLAQ